PSRCIECDARRFELRPHAEIRMDLDNFARDLRRERDLAIRDGRPITDERLGKIDALGVEDVDVVHLGSRVALGWRSLQTGQKLECTEPARENPAPQKKRHQRSPKLLEKRTTRRRHRHSNWSLSAEFTHTETVSRYHIHRRDAMPLECTRRKVSEGKAPKSFAFTSGSRFLLLSLRRHPTHAASK